MNTPQLLSLLFLFHHFARTDAAKILLPRQNATDTNLPNPSNATTLPRTGTGSYYASICNSVKQSWEDGMQTASAVSTLPVRILPTSYQQISAFYIHPSSDGELHTLCDGFPRSDGPSPITIGTTSTWETSSYTVGGPETSYSLYQTTPAPICTIQTHDCSVLQSSWTSASESFSSAYSSWSACGGCGPPLTPLDAPPICGAATTPLYQTAVGDPVCGVNGISMTLLYWPVSTAGGCSQCSRQSCSTMTAIATIPGQPNTVVTLGTTLTSPTVYYALDGTWSYNINGSTVQNQTNFILPQTSEAVSSYCYTAGSNSPVPHPFNYADLVGPIPATAYRCQQRCWETTYINSSVPLSTGATENQCSTIYDDYAPALSIPAAFSSLTPAVGTGDQTYNCNFIFDYNGTEAVFWDPPSALVQAEFAASPTLPHAGPAPTTDPVAGITSTPAQPASSAAERGPQPTAEPLTTPTPPGPSQSEQDPDPPKASSHQGGESAPGQPSTLSGSSLTTAPAQSADPVPQQSAQPHPTDPAESSSPTNIGDLIASVMGITEHGMTDTNSPRPTQKAVITGSNGQRLTAVVGPHGEMKIGSITLHSGQTTSIDGIGSIVAGSSAVVLNGITHSMSPQSPLLTPGAVVTVDGNVYTAGPNGDVIATRSGTAYTIPSGGLTQGGVATISGSIISLGSNGGFVVVNGVTQGLSEALSFHSASTASDTPSNIDQATSAKGEATSEPENAKSSATKLHSLLFLLAISSGVVILIAS